MLQEYSSPLKINKPDPIYIDINPMMSYHNVCGVHTMHVHVNHYIILCHDVFTIVNLVLAQNIQQFDIRMYKNTGNL